MIKPEQIRGTANIKLRAERFVAGKKDRPKRSQIEDRTYNQDLIAVREVRHIKEATISINFPARRILILHNPVSDHRVMG